MEKRELHSVLTDFLNERLIQVTASGQAEKNDFLKAKIRPVLTKGVLHFQAEEFIGKQAFHKNLTAEEAVDYLEGLMETSFRQLQLEAQDKSGTMSTVNHAERYGKPVFVVPGSIYSPNSAGTNALLREGRAKAVCKPGDLFGVLGLRGAAVPAVVRSAPDPMSETERRVLACIGPKAKGVEELGAASGLPTGLLLGTLMKLELAGRVTCLPGTRYILR